jgi:hypothetical protein
MTPDEAEEADERPPPKKAAKKRTDTMSVKGARYAARKSLGALNNAIARLNDLAEDANKWKVMAHYVERINDFIGVWGGNEE